jgi:superfamily II DNA/RNA helicase
VAALDAFKRGHARVLVATDIASRGIDVEGISHVINFDFPMHPEDYVHRIGRTGRADAVGDAISFITPDDEPYVRDLEKMIKKTIARKRVQGFDYTEVAAPQWRDGRFGRRTPDHSTAEAAVAPPRPPSPSSHRDHFPRQSQPSGAHERRYDRPRSRRRV